MYANTAHELREDVKPLTKAEKVWLKRLEKIFSECPSTRLEFSTGGDATLSIIDGQLAREHDLDIHDGFALRNGVDLGAIKTGKCKIHSVTF